MIFAKSQEYKNIPEYIMGFRRTIPYKQLYQPLYSSFIPLSILMILLWSMCDWTSDLWQQLGLASALESDLSDTVHWGRKTLVNFDDEKTQLVAFDNLSNCGAIDVKIDRPFLDENLMCYSLLENYLENQQKRCHTKLFIKYWKGWQ